MGWYRQDRVAGAILTARAGTPEEETSGLIEERVREGLLERLPVEPRPHSARADHAAGAAAAREGIRAAGVTKATPGSPSRCRRPRLASRDESGCRPSGGAAAAQESAGSFVLGESVFKDALVRERKRADRFDAPFAVVLVDRSDDAPEAGPWISVLSCRGRREAGSRRGGLARRGRGAGPAPAGSLPGRRAPRDGAAAARDLRAGRRQRPGGRVDARVRPRRRARPRRRRLPARGPAD